MYGLNASGGAASCVETKGFAVYLGAGPTRAARCLQVKGLEGRPGRNSEEEVLQEHNRPQRSNSKEPLSERKKLQ
ncbi:fibrosin-1-like protein [Arapaima gigas]